MLRGIGRLRAGGGFNPFTLFQASEQGVWYDVADLSTMYQDSAGTTAAVVDQPVGLILDKRLGAQPTGSELIPQPVNFGSNWAATAGGGPSANGSSFTTTGVGGFWISGLTAGKVYRVTVAGSTSASGITLRQTDTVTTSEIRSGFGTATFRVSAGFTHFYIRNEGAGTTAVTSITVKEIPGNHATQSTSASRPTLKQDASGFYYLQFDGTDDSLATGSIDFSSTDKMTVWAGVRKAADGARGLIVELGNNPGTATFLLDASPDTLDTYRFASNGTTGASAQGSGFTAPHSGVLTGIGNIAGDSAILRVNGTQAASSSSDQGTGNYRNDVLYIGRRGGSTLPFNGRLYQFIARGASSETGQITGTERFIGQRMGVSL